MRLTLPETAAVLGLSDESVDSVHAGVVALVARVAELEAVAAPVEWREGVFDMDRIEWLQSELRRYDTMHLKSAAFVRNEHSITPPVGTLEHFRFTGLRQSDLCCFWDGTEPAAVDEAITADLDFDSPHDADDGGDCEGANDGQV